MRETASFHRITNVFSDKHRKQLIKDSKPHLTLGTNGIWYTKDIQFQEDFKFSCSHIINRFEEMVGEKLFLMNVWITYTKGESLDYHTHPYDFGCVYYMRTNSFLQNNGTSFKLTNGKTKLVETPQNGALLFPGKMVHAAPSFFLPVTRYTLSMDVNYSWRMQ